MMLPSVNEEMQASEPVVGASVGVSGVQSRSEDEESLSMKDVKRTAAQAFGGGVPKRRSSSRYCSTLDKTILYKKKKKKDIKECF